MFTPPKIWENGTCWILGGGASITSQFHIDPNIVQSVRKGQLPISAYAPFMSKLHDKHVIGINGAYRLGNWVDICFFGDIEWLWENQHQLSGYNGLVVGCSEHLASSRLQHFGVKYIPCDANKSYGISSVKGKVCWNFNSGSAAISLAYQMGCKKIILLGFDMNLENGTTGHWHNLYNGKTNMPFNRHLVGFEQIAVDAKNLGIQIINASPHSSITQFEKLNVDQLI